MERKKIMQRMIQICIWTFCMLGSNYSHDVIDCFADATKKRTHSILS